MLKQDVQHIPSMLNDRRVDCPDKWVVLFIYFTILRGLMTSLKQPIPIIYQLRYIRVDIFKYLSTLVRLREYRNSIENKEQKSMKKDPVCGMEVDEHTTKYTSEHMGKKFYFCAEMCKKKFDEAPMKYMKH